MINGNFIGAEKKAVQVGSPHHCDDRSLPLRGIGHQYSPDRVVWQMDSVKLKGELKIPRTNIQHPEKIQESRSNGIPDHASSSASSGNDLLCLMASPSLADISYE